MEPSRVLPAVIGLEASTGVPCIALGGETGSGIERRSSPALKLESGIQHVLLMQSHNKSFVDNGCARNCEL